MVDLLVEAADANNAPLGPADANSALLRPLMSTRPLRSPLRPTVVADVNDTADAAEVTVEAHR